jgi:hypothetical protein
VLGETVGREARVAVLQGTGRKMRPVQDLGLGAGEAEREILGEGLGAARLAPSGLPLSSLRRSNRPDGRFVELARADRPESSLGTVLAHHLWWRNVTPRDPQQQYLQLLSDAE